MILYFGNFDFSSFFLDLIKLTIFLFHDMDPFQSYIVTLKPESSSSDLCFEIIDKILSFLPRYVATKYNQNRDSILICARVCGNWHNVARRFANWFVDLKNEEDARRFLAALVSNDAFIKRDPGWPRMNSTRCLVLGNVSGLLFVF
jgi:hypothetical protein